MACAYLEYCSPYVLALLDAEENAKYDQHLARGCADCTSELKSLGQAIEVLSVGKDDLNLSPSIKAKVLERITREQRGDAKSEVRQVWKNWNTEDPAGGLITHHAGEGEWEGISIDGISVKRLYSDPGKTTATMLVRMAAGTAYPSHRHAGPEECLVLEGDLHVGDSIVLRAGDYQRAGSDSIHVKQWTEEGCLLFIVSSTEDQLLE